MRGLLARWRAGRRWQWVYDARPGWYIVLSHLGSTMVDPGERWELELTSPEGRTRLRYFRTRRAAIRWMRGLGIRPVRRASTRR